MAPVLGYWKIRGLAQHIRLMLEYVGENYEEKLYSVGPAPNYDRSQWNSVKNTLGLPFPNLPYYVEGEVKITQSNAIMRYIARKHNMCGETDQQKVKVDVLENEAMDFRMRYVYLAYMHYSEQAKKEYLENLKNVLQSYSDFLGNQKWFAGEKITFIDFILYELFAVHKELEKTCLESFPNLKAFVKCFEDLPAIKKYMSSPKFMRSPLNNPAAKIGNK